ncbi:MAG: PKD domain-containing protein [Candidatus Electrothrix sp. AR4]|nr:PKD domain-containing protein [Candidatus Electrothrix sp. AR4]
MHLTKQSLITLTLLFLLSVCTDNAQALSKKQNFLITTGPEATENHFHRSVFYFEVDRAYTGKLFVRIFDADFSESLDVDPAASTVRYRVYGGQDFNQILRNVNDPLPIRKPLVSLELGENKSYDNQWRTIARLDPIDGQLPYGQSVFQLVVDGMSGKGSNKFQVFISSKEKSNAAISGLRLYSPIVSLQLPAAATMDTELRFIAPATSKYIEVTNFDADSVDFDTHIHFSSKLRPKVPVDVSKNKTAKSTKIPLLAGERGKTVALVLSSRKVNFVQLWVNDDQGNKIPLELPPFLAPSNHPPKPDKTATPLSDCNTVVLDASGSTDKDGDDLDFQWSFSDGTTAVGSRITHDFKNPGEYTVNLTVQDDSSFTANTGRLDFPVLINAPPKGHITAPASAAVNEEVLFDGRKSTDMGGKIIRYRWQIGEGRKLKGPLVRHSFSQPGLYQVSLQVEDDGEGLCTTDRVHHTIRINAAPVAKINVKRVVAPGEATVLTAKESIDSDGKITLYSWDFDDKTKGSGETAKHAWQQAGSYEVRLQIRDNSGLSNDRGTASAKVLVNAPPEPVISASPLIVAVDTPVTFTGKKSRDVDGNIINYAWNFGDGITKNGKTLTHAYAKPGLYTVRLMTTDDSGVSNAAQSIEQQIRVNSPPIPVIQTSDAINSGHVHFDASGATDADDAIISYRWDFGDGKHGKGMSVDHVYALPGIYTTQLRITDASGSASAVQETTAEVIINHPPVADAGADQRIAPGDIVRFDGGRSLDPDGVISAFQWQVMNQRSEQQVFPFRFQHPGRYQAGLTVTDNHGASQSDHVTVTVNRQPTARFAPLPRIEPGKKITLDASASDDTDGKIITYSWDLGDGNKAEGVRPTHVYAQPGRYQVMLTVRDDSGVKNDSDTTQHIIAVNYPPAADAGDPLHTCEQIVFFDASKSSDPERDQLSYTWDFGDKNKSRGVKTSHQFIAHGVYPVTLTVDDNTGLGNSDNTDMTMVHINSPPEAIIRTDDKLVCVGEHVLFDASLSKDPEGGPLRYFWNFGDGHTVEDASPVHTYEQAGDYSVSLKVVDDSGLACNSGHARKNIHVVSAPVAKAGKDLSSCTNTSVPFDGTHSSGGTRSIIRYTWNFGDGGSDVGGKTSHVYTEPGLYAARLTVQTPDLGGCNNHAEDELKVRIFSAPSADFHTSDGCVGEPIAFDASDSAEDNKTYTAKGADSSDTVSYVWDFGDGATDTGVSTEHIYRQPGSYTTGLKVKTTEDTLCNSSVSNRRVRINHPPTAHIALSMAGKELYPAGLQDILTNTLLHFSAAGSMDADGTIKKVSWDFGDGRQATGWFVEHRFKQPGQYKVRLTVEDNSGLSCKNALAEISITVVQQPALRITGPKLVCINQTAQYSLINNKLLNMWEVRWRFDNKHAGRGNHVKKTFIQPGVQKIQTMIKGHPGPSESVMVVTLPQLDLPDKISVIAGEELAVAAIPVTAPPVHDTGMHPLFSWDSGDDKIREKKFENNLLRHVYRQPGRYTARLTMTDGSDKLDCPAVSHEVEVTVLPPPSAKLLHEPKQIFSGGARDEVLFRAEVDQGQGGWNYHWDFGDKSKAEGAKVNHVFEQPGIYTVTLTLTDGGGTAQRPYTFSKEVTVRAHSKK